MPLADLSLVAGYAAQAVVATVLALLLLLFYRQYRKSYLEHWTLSWFALGGYYGLTAAALWLALRTRMPAIHPLRIALSAAGGALGYMAIAWLLFGVFELLRRRPVRLQFYGRTLAAAALFGAALSLFFINSDPGISAARYFVRIGLRHVITSVLYAITAYECWKARRRRKGVGFTMLSLTFLLYMFDSIRQVGLSVITSNPIELFVTDVCAFILPTMLGMSMIASLLEDEREASELASIEVSHLAYTDPLTGLPNRPLFMDHLILALAQASRSNQRVAVFFLDLDRFKDINDSLGHSTGDALLRSVAERVRHCVREGDTVARFGGDEFTLLIPRIANVDDASNIARKVQETLKIPFTIGERELFITTSIGISIYPSDGTDPETLVRNADTAMYRAKDAGRDNYHMYAPAMNARSLERLALENMLRRAIENDELVLHYQPLVDARSRRVVGVEALIRWQHPDLGLLSPAHFISAAELSGLIVPIGSWVLRTACRQAKIWRKKIEPDLRVAVNLSARQFQQANLVEEVRSVLAETGLEPHALELEITESNAMQNAENTIHTLRELKALGVHVAMDDFGTGYSSLNYLKRFPIDTLKLDRSFVRDVTTDATDAAIVNAVISMAHSLSLRVIAEGVETAEQLELLTQQNTDRIQGFYFSAPLPLAQLESYLAEHKAATAVEARHS